ncbi:MAG: class I tRNA ligase family protein, partial [Candidatus Magasanikbacteria bacterium]|nr:class I tRNA ligase family protein [Candidatus Magasanikbacteria bacterium]
LDTWILARLQQVVGEVTHEMNAYRLAEAVRPLFDFVSDVSQWYVRRSRDRFKGLTTEADKQAALQTLRQVLFTTSQLLAPFAPFLAEKIFLSVKQGSDETSVHLTEWPNVDAALLQEDVLSSMQRTRDLVSLGLSTRAAKGLKVRQILGELRLAQGMALSSDYIALVQDELNVKTISTVEEAGTPTSDDWVAVGQEEVSYLYTTITPELQKEGVLRELVRAVNMMRKDHGLTIDDTVVVEYHTESPLLLSVFETYAGELAKQVLAKEIVVGSGGTSVDVGGESVSLVVTKIV